VPPTQKVRIFENNPAQHGNGQIPREEENPALIPRLEFRSRAIREKRGDCVAVIDDVLADIAVGADRRSRIRVPPQELRTPEEYEGRFDELSRGFFTAEYALLWRI